MTMTSLGRDTVVSVRLHAKEIYDKLVELYGKQKTVNGVLLQVEYIVIYRDVLSLRS